MTAEELDEVETDDLVSALRRRSTASLIALFNDLDKNRESKIVYYSGGMTALGLTNYASEYIRRAFFEPNNLVGE